MELKIEKFLNKIADTQRLAPRDRLTEVVEQYGDDELDEDSLDLVFAAAKPNFPRFLELLDKKNN